MIATRLAAVTLASLVASTAAATASALDSPRDGDFVHAPVAEQRANTPVPVYVELPGASLGRVVVKYAGTGVKTWTRLEMKRLGSGWGALIPCAAVTPGAMRYWIQGFDPSGEPSASSGDPKHPFVVPIRDAAVAKPPHLPDRAPPQTCDESAPASEEAEEDKPPPAPLARAAREDEGPAAEEGGRASAGREGAEPSYARWWIGVAGAVDFVSLPGGSDVCSLTAVGTPANASGYYCTNPNGSDFPARTAAGAKQNGELVRGSAGQVPGGIQAGDLRAMIAVDYALTPSVLLGARIGYVMNSYPTGGAAVADHRALGARAHVEARATYVFGDDPLAHPGFAPTVFGALGISEFDGHTTTIVSYTTGTSALPVNQPVDAWLTNGPWFLAVGGGARYQFSQRAAFTAAARVNVAFGGAGALFTLGPEIQFQYGF